MDNAAFTALVRGRAQGKTSKVIAREAVEEEFRRRKKKRRRGDGEDYLSSEEEGADGDDNRKSKSQRFDTKNDWDISGNGGVGGTEGTEEGESKYRDRAKERRDGKHQQQQLQSNFPPTRRTNGEDGEDGDDPDGIVPSNAKKGLDLELVRQMKREIHYGSTSATSASANAITNKQNSKAMRSILRPKGYHDANDDDNNNNTDKMVQLNPASISVDEARKFLQARISTPSTSTTMGGDRHITNDDHNHPTNKALSKNLGYNLFEYLESVLHHHPSATMTTTTTTSELPRGSSRRTDKRATSSSSSNTAGIQRGMQQAHSTAFLVFALEGNPWDKIRSWETPREFTRHGKGRRRGGGDKPRGGLTRQQEFLETDDDDNDDVDSEARATPLNKTILQAIEGALAKHSSKQAPPSVAPTLVSRPMDWQNDTTMKTAATSTVRDASATNSTATTSRSHDHLPPYAMKGTTQSTSRSSSTSAKLGSNRHDDDDDDDIFGDDSGSGYIYSAPENAAKPPPAIDNQPPHTKPSSLTKQAEQPLSATTRISKGSIFSGLVASNKHDNNQEDENEEEGEGHCQGGKDKSSSSSDQVDHFVQNLYSRLRQRGQQQQGPAMSSSKWKGSEQGGGGEGGYDEELDVDFDGRLDDEDGSSQDDKGQRSDTKSKKKKGGSSGLKKKQAAETTLAVKDYGASRGRRSAMREAMMDRLA
jgi:hypothetical protein